MRTIPWLMIVTLFSSFVAAGCRPAVERPAEAPRSNEAVAADHPVAGNVVSIAPDRSAVTLDHEDIPGVMPAMEMRFTVEDPQILEGIEVGSAVEGRLQVENGDYIITHLEER